MTYQQEITLQIDIRRRTLQIDDIRRRILEIFPDACEWDGATSRERVARASISAGKMRGMRIWADNVGNPGMLLYNATTSVERILGIRAYGRGGCRAWVLDLVEAGVEQLERDRVLVGGA